MQIGFYCYALHGASMVPRNGVDKPEEPCRIVAIGLCGHKAVIARRWEVPSCRACYDDHGDGSGPFTIVSFLGNGSNHIVPTRLLRRSPQVTCVSVLFNELSRARIAC